MEILPNTAVGAVTDTAFTSQLLRENLFFKLKNHAATTLKNILAGHQMSFQIM